MAKQKSKKAQPSSGQSQTAAQSKSDALALADRYAAMLLDGCATHAQVAARVGKSVAHVEQMLLLASADEVTRDLVRRGVVPVYAASAAVRLHRGEAGSVLLSLIRDGRSRVSRDAVLGWVPSRKLAQALAGAVEALVASLPDSAVARLRQDGEWRGRSVPVSGAVLRAVLDVHARLSRARQASERRANGAAASAAKGEREAPH